MAIKEKTFHTLLCRDQLVYKYERNNKGDFLSGNLIYRLLLGCELIFIFCHKHFSMLFVSTWGRPT